MANTKKPEGLTVTRAGLKFTTKWKIRDKDYGDGQQFQYAVFTTQKKYESALNFIRQGFTITSGVTWHNVSVRSSSTSATVSLSAGSFFPTAKKPYLAGIIFRVRGNRKAYTEKEKYKDSKGRTKYRDVTVNPGWSAWAYKGFDITAPAAPKASVAWSEDYINRTTFSWDCGNETQGAPYTRCVYQTVTALDYNGKVENIPAWKSATNNNVTSRQDSTYRDEPNLADKNLTRAYRIKAVGPGGESAWRYARHPYGAPEQAVNVTCETTRNEAVGSYHLVIAWTAPNSVANPITKTTAEYLIAEPGGIVETEQGLFPTVPAQAQWTPFPATKDTNGANAFSFDLQETLGDDECLWVHVITTHDNHDTPSEAVLAAKGTLQKPTITNLETDASTHRAEITIQAGTSVPGAFHAIKYEPADGSSDPDAGKIIGIIPNGSTVAQIQCPAWTATPAFGVYAVLGEEESDYTRTDGVTIYTLNEVMTSAVESSGGNVPQAPENVRAAQIGTSDTIQVLWDVVWNEATGAEVSWADHADAWISTEQPQTFDVQNLRESVLNITGLELGKVWFIRVRLYQTNTGGTNVYGPYSDIIPVDLSTIPAVPDLQISDEDGIIPATGSTVASWVYVSEDGTRQKAATLAEVTYEDDEPVYTRLMGLTTQQRATLNAEALGWETGTQHEVAVQVTSESGNPSKWSAPVTITIADAISCDITQTSLEYDNVPINPETYTGNPITFDSGEQEKEVLSLNVELLPVQDLHGYDKPWGAGAGKNKSPVNLIENQAWASSNPQLLTALNSLPNGTYTVSAKSTLTSLTMPSATSWLTGFVFTNSYAAISARPTATSFAVGDVLYVNTSFVINDNNRGLFINAYVYGAGNDNVGTIGTATLSEIQIEQGNTKTDFAPYENNCPITGRTQTDVVDSNGTDTTTTTVTLPHTVYGADVDVTGGAGKETVNNIELTNNISCSLSSQTDDVAVFDAYFISNGWASHSSNPQAISNRFSTETPAGNAGRMVILNQHLYFVIAKSELSSVTQSGARAWLNDHPTQLCYELATPTDLQTTPTDVELLTGVNNISADGDMELTIADTIESGYYLKELPLTATVTGAGPGGQTSLRIERAESYELDGPDDKTRNGFEGAAAAEVQQAGENQIEVDLADLIGRLDDGARYRIRASVQDAAGQSAEAEPVEFTVLWNKQAGIPGGTAEIENGVAIITPEAPENANEGDTVDIYRLSADRPELIVRGGTFGTQYVDPYPTLNEFGGYRIVTVTEYGDYITEDNEMAWTDIRTNNDSLFQYIDFDGNQLELKYNAELSNTWTKQFTATRYLGGSIRGDWLEGTQQEANVNGIVLRDIDQDTYRTLRALGDFSGICHVRTTDGSNFTANINVQSGSTYNSPGHPESVTLTITRVDNPRADGMTLAEWQTQESE